MIEPISRSEARRRLGIMPRPFARLLHAGVFRRIGSDFDPVSLNANHARAVEIERQAEAQIATIRCDAARRLAALGAPLDERKLP